MAIYAPPPPLTPQQVMAAAIATLPAHAQHDATSLAGALGGVMTLRHLPTDDDHDLALVGIADGLQAGAGEYADQHPHGAVLLFYRHDSEHIPTVYWTRAPGAVCCTRQQRDEADVRGMPLDAQYWCARDRMRQPLRDTPAGSIYDRLREGSEWRARLDFLEIVADEESAGQHAGAVRAYLSRLAQHAPPLPPKGAGKGGKGGAAGSAGAPPVAAAPTCYIHPWGTTP